MSTAERGEVRFAPWRGMPASGPRSRDQEEEGDEGSDGHQISAAKVRRCSEPRMF